MSCPVILSPVCDVVGAAGSAVVGTGIDAVMSGVTGWFVTGAAWLLDQLGGAMDATTSPDLSQPWFLAHYGSMLKVAAVVALPMLLMSAVQAIWRQSPGALARAVFVHLPLAGLLAGVAVAVVQLALGVTDALSSAVSSGDAGGMKQALSAVASGLSNLALTSTPGVVVALGALLVVAGALVLWLELLVREAAVYVAVLFLPLAFASVVWPAVSHWCRRLVETLAAVVLSKFVIVAVLSLAVGAVGSASSGFATVLAGGALLALAAFAPFTLLRLVPAIEAGAAMGLDGARQRLTRAAVGVGRSAASLALQAADGGSLGAVPGIGTPGMANDPGYDSSWFGGSGDATPTTTDDEGEDERDRYYWSDGTDGGPPGPRRAADTAFMRAYEQALREPRPPRQEAIGGWGTGWTRPIWGGEPSEEHKRDPEGEASSRGRFIVGRDAVGPRLEWIPPERSRGADGEEQRASTEYDGV